MFATKDCAIHPQRDLALTANQLAYQGVGQQLRVWILAKGGSHAVAVNDVDLQLYAEGAEGVGVVNRKDEEEDEKAT